MFQERIDELNLGDVEVEDIEFSSFSPENRTGKRIFGELYFGSVFPEVVDLGCQNLAESLQQVFPHWLVNMLYMEIEFI